MVTKISFKNKKQNHTLWVDGSPVNFKNGIAKVDDETAKKIKKLENPDYKVEKSETSTKGASNNKQETKPENAENEDDETAKKQESKDKKKNGEK